MYKFFQKNQKKMLAIFGVLLMIVFILPTGMKTSMGNVSDPVVAKLGKSNVLRSEMQKAREEWNYLNSLTQFDRRTGQQVKYIQSVLPAPLVKEIEGHPE